MELSILVLRHLDHNISCRCLYIPHQLADKWYYLLDYWKCPSLHFQKTLKIQGAFGWAWPVMPWAGRKSIIRAHTQSNFQRDPPPRRPSPSRQQRHFCDFPSPILGQNMILGRVFCFWAAVLLIRLLWSTCWRYGPVWCMFAVSAEITLNASERAPPAEQYVLNPSGWAVCRSARKNFLPPSTWQGSDTQPRARWWGDMP